MAKLKKFDSINVVPFIDVMLVLLTIVLTVATFVAQGTIPVDLPKAASKEASKLKPIEIVIKSDGKIYYQTEAVTKDGLKLKLQNVTKNDQITVKSDQNSTFQLFVDVIDALKERNIEKISIATKANE
ncbi:MAG TPA: biopolymer transporter ExbD [Campylobacterales bacterium]|nr:biopolymer transporter ExbD [Campylobacterales bacterium]